MSIITRFRAYLADIKERAEALAEFESWADALAEEKRQGKVRPGRYELNNSPLIAEFLDEHSDWIIADGGDSELTGYLAVYPLMPWQRLGDPQRYGLWTSSSGFRVYQIFETHGAALAVLADLEAELAAIDEAEADNLARYMEVH